jgi:hypothetical protein
MLGCRWPIWSSTASPSIQGQSWSWSHSSWIYNHLCNHCLSPLMLWIRILHMVRYTTLFDKIYQWLATGRWFSPRTLITSTNKTDRHDITEILFKVALNTIRLTNHPHYNKKNIFPFICPILTGILISSQIFPTQSKTLTVFSLIEDISHI